MLVPVTWGKFRERFAVNTRKVSEAQILSGLYWDYICSIGNVN